ncbi:MULTISPECIES: hypothetical protein [Clostridium]|uniref:Uncharacterized protein n=1 Tax=Clostridium paridis TaxID=2803863 RepID=A0A937FHL7_9CLOT|nr:MULTISPECIES: hypothetical protein [Clostridium]MBL4932178.1 hypothetical protein [Clostridium paridis]
MEINDFITFDFLSSYVGTVIVTMLIVQFLKDIPFIKKIPTRYFTFLVAFITILISGIYHGTISFSNLYIMLINAILVTFTATGGYDFAARKVSINVDKSNNSDGEK